jgi:drug/metabolite transporter (DMT)-like permease
VLGGVVALGLAVARNEAPLQQRDVIWAVLAGTAGPLALVFFYRGLAVGRMGVVAPISGVLGAAIPVVVGSITLGLPAPIQICGIALAIVAVILVTRSAEESPEGTSGVAMALLAGVGFGAFFVLLAQVSNGAAFWPLVVVRIAAGVILGAILIVSRAPWRPARAVMKLVLLAAVLDMAGNVWFLLASQQGRLDVAAVLSSLYPIMTIVLAALVLHERIGRLQAAGIAAAITAIVLIGAG